MVLRLMLSFIKRGSASNDELQDIATEALKNLLCVLLNTKLLGFVSPKGGGPAEASSQGEVPVWWQMTWDCIEVFLPGFGEEFTKSIAPQKEDAGLERSQVASTALAAADTAAS